MEADGRILSDSQQKQLEEVKKGIRSLLIAEAKEEVTLRRLNELYEEFFGTDIPIQNFYFSSLAEFLARMPDVCELRTNKKNVMCVQFVESEKTKHISDMKKKEKVKDNRKKKSVAHAVKDYHQNHNFLVPKLLVTILHELRGPNCLPKIKKNDVLLKAVDYQGPYAFYNLESLHNQLSDYTHLLYYDDEFIYFKKIFETEKTKYLDNKSNVSIVKTNDNVHIEENDIVKERTQKSLRELIKKYNAIKTWDLPRAYRKEFQKDLDWQMYGFHNIVEFCNSLPHILTLVQTPDGRQIMVTDAENPIEFPLEKECTASPEKNDSEPAVPLKVVSRQRYRTLINLTPKNAVRFDESIRQISVENWINSNEMLTVFVTNVISPSFFWVQVASNARCLDRLIKDLEQFYKTAQPAVFELPLVFLRPGVWVACKVLSTWCRGLITDGNLEKSEAKVFLIDYGTVSYYPAKSLCFLDKRFMNIPAQAIPCSLHNVEPLSSKRWTFKDVKIFRSKVVGKCFAHINSIDKKSNSMKILLFNGKSDRSINDWLTMNNMAKYGNCNVKIRNPVIEQLQHCNTKSTIPVKLSSTLVNEKSHEKSALEVSNSDLSETSFSSLSKSDSSDMQQFSDSQSITDSQKSTSSYETCDSSENLVMKKFIARLKKKKQNQNNSSESTMSDTLSESSKSDTFQSCASSLNFSFGNPNSEGITTRTEDSKISLKTLPIQRDVLKELRHLQVSVKI
ncbi:hypothetical protein TKK_0001120 [Trichogramma kaykai]|uniref:HTH OST-type domain-containing protein n=1 Tax=Trichogramma kaykai TaxID=54128 RepID=A0ABD2WS19_9HYME